MVLIWPKYFFTKSNYNESHFVNHLCSSIIIFVGLLSEQESGVIICHCRDCQATNAASEGVLKIGKTINRNN